MPLPHTRPAGRRVRRLTVRAPREDAARHATVLLTDALSTASLPGSDRERLIVIRRLALGRISVHLSPASLALHIEKAAQEVRVEAVSDDLAAADRANAVAFASRGAAIVALARVHAIDAPADQWFWPQIVTGWSPSTPRADRWVCLLDAAHAVPEAAVLAAAVVEQAIRARAEDDLLSSIPAGHGARWLRMEGWSSISPAFPPDPWRRLDRHRDEMVRRWSTRWAATDDRLIWFATMATLIERPASAGDAQLPSRIAFALPHINDTVPLRSAPSESRSGDGERHKETRRPPNGVDVSSSPAVTHPRSIADPTPMSSSARVPASVDETLERLAPTAGSSAQQAVARQEPLAARFHSVARDGVFTFFAGLFFVVPILQRLDFAAFLAAHPALVEEAFPARLLWHIGRRAGLTANDLLSLAFEEELGTDEPVRAAVTLPSEPWGRAVRRWCRRHARMGLTTLIRRPGVVHLSRTHIDTSFALSQLDVRVRRLALDVDPGWVPWMGRVVQFRYEDHDVG